MLATAAFLLAVVPAGTAHAATPLAGANVRMNQDTGTAPQNEIHVSVNPSDGQNVVGGANDYRTGGGTGFYTTIDGGTSWTDGTLPMPAGVDPGGDPVVRFNRDGTRVLFTHLGFESTEALKGCDPLSGAYVSSSTDKGLSWGTSAIVAANSDLVFNDKPWITSDRTTGIPGRSGNVYLTYTKFTYTTTLACQAGDQTPASPIKLRRSTDGGTTWDAEVDVSGAYLASQGSAPAVGPDGTLYVAFESYTTCADCLVVARSADGGQTFSQVKVADIVGIQTLPAGASTFRADSFPALAVAPDGTLYLVWAEKRGSSTAEVWFSTSSGGTVWSQPARVNSSTAGDQFFPGVTVDASGVVWVSYSDRRDDPSNILYRQYVSHSHDGGATWSDTQVASQASDPRTVQFEGEFFIGDYNGVDAAPGGGVWMGWTDTRRGTGHQDAFAARVDLGGEPTTLTASVAPVIGVWGTTFTVSGFLRKDSTGVSGRQVTIQRRPVGTAPWLNVTTVASGSDGSYAGTVGIPDRSTDYRAVFAGGGGLLGSVSAAARAQVRVGIPANVSDPTIARGQTAVLSGRVLPEHPGKRASLQQLTPQGWRTIQTVVLGSASSFRFSVRLSVAGFRLYRVVFATQDADHAWNVSRNLGVTWS